MATAPPGAADTGDDEPLAPPATSEPGDREGFLIPGGPGSDPDQPILSALHELAVEITDAKGSPSASAVADAPPMFGNRIPLGAHIGNLARTAGEAVQEFAFPLTLAIAVLLFLLFQGELDRRDPKLAYAPVDGNNDMVSFE